MGDLTQLLMANLAAHYHSPLSVGLGAVVPLWAASALAVLGGQGLLRVLLRVVPVRVLRRLTGAAMLAFGVVAAWSAVIS